MEDEGSAKHDYVDGFCSRCKEEEPSAGLLFTKQGKGYRVSGYEGEATRVVIPSLYEGYPVDEIGYGAFRSCATLTEVVIPSSVVSVGGRAFESCAALSEITLPESISYLGQYAFFNCDALTEIVIPESVTSIGNNAFSSCGKLTSIKFNGTVEQWNSITKGSSWNLYVPATKVICTDGEVTL